MNNTIEPTNSNFNFQNDEWWQLFDTKTKRFYYYNLKEQKTSWHKPNDSSFVSTHLSTSPSNFDNSNNTSLLHEDEYSNLDESSIIESSSSSLSPITHLLASKIIHLIINNYHSTSNKQKIENLLQEIEFNPSGFKSNKVMSDLEFLLKQDDIVNLMHESKLKSKYSNSELKKSISLSSNNTNNTATKIGAEKSSTPNLNSNRPVQPRTNPNYINIDLIENKNGSSQIKNTYVKLEDIKANSNNKSEDLTNDFRKLLLNQKPTNNYSPNNSYFSDLTQATIVLIQLLNRINQDKENMTSSNKNSGICDEIGKISVSSLKEKFENQKKKYESHTLCPKSSKLKHQNKESIFNEDDDDQSSSNEALLDMSSPRNQSKKIYAFSPSTTSLSDLTSVHKNSSSNQHHINQRLKNLRRSFNNKKVTCLNDKNSSLSYMVSSNELNKLALNSSSTSTPKQEGSNSDYTLLNSLTRKPSESNLQLLSSIDLNTHHEKSGGFLFFSSKKKIQNQDLMIWTSQTIQKPLIRTNNKIIKKEACDLFKLIQMYMGDRKLILDLKQYFNKQHQQQQPTNGHNKQSSVWCASVCDEHAPVQNFFDQINLNLNQRDLICLEIMTKGWLHAQLRDELYLQIIKQTTSNLSHQSNLFGWQLLAICLSFFPPTQKLYPYLSEYIQNQSNLNTQVIQLFYLIFNI